MCGIAVLTRFGGQVTAEEIAALVAGLRHRGPDGQGQRLYPSRGPFAPADVALGHTRLAVIDLTPGGAQPMSFEGLHLVFNGEIYNYLELRQELVAAGHRFRSESDTEVLLQAWAAWGEECLPRLNGIFAFAVWDERRATLSVARDRVGVKPVYWCRTGDTLAFASEIRPLLSLAGIGRDARLSRVHDFLVSGRLDAGEETFFRDVARLPAGSLLTARPGAVSVRQYWRAPRTEGPLTDPDLAAERFSSLFRDAVRLQMRADVPVACCLSGGLDSSALAGVAARLSPTPLETFCARFGDPSMDEGCYADAVRAASGAVACDVLVEPQPFWDGLRACVQAQEEPFGGPGVFAQWSLMRRIHERGIKVVLDGQGGDELLCGYAKYFYLQLREDLVAGRWLRLARSALLGLTDGGAHLRYWPGARRYLPGGLGVRSLRGRLLSAELQAAGEARPVSFPGSVRAQQLRDIEEQSLPALLRYEDKNSMAFSVESRVPFLDHRLIELCVALPTAFKIQGPRAKRVLRQGLADALPRAVLARRTKLGFGGSYRSWLVALERPLRDWLRTPRLPMDRFVRREECQRLLARRDVSLFRPLILDAWLAELQVAA